jgi:hypothetical protein
MRLIKRIYEVKSISQATIRSVNSCIVITQTAFMQSPQCSSPRKSVARKGLGLEMGIDEVDFDPNAIQGQTHFLANGRRQYDTACMMECTMECSSATPSSWNVH